METANVPRSYKKEGNALGVWVDRQRSYYRQLKAGKKTSITPEEVELLNALGFEWAPAEAQWNLWLERLQQFHQQYGHFRIPRGYKTSEAADLYKWVAAQRKMYEKFKTGKSSQLTQERIDRLASIGFDITASDDASESHAVALAATEADAGTSSDDEEDEEEEDDEEEEGGSPPPEPYAAAPAESIFDADAGFDATSSDDEEEEEEYPPPEPYAAAPAAIAFAAPTPRSRQSRTGSTPNANKRRAVLPIMHEDDQSSDNDSNNKRQKGSDGKPIAKRAFLWNSNYQSLVHFKEENGHCRVPQIYKTEEGGALGVWVKDQRTYYRRFQQGTRSPMTQERIDQLNAIGFDWVHKKDSDGPKSPPKKRPKRARTPAKTPNGESASKKRQKRSDAFCTAFYEKLKQFKEEHGHCRIPQSYQTADGKPLGRWCYEERTEYRRFQDGKETYMTQERIDELDAVGFVRDAYDTQWQLKFEFLREYQQKHGHCRVPNDFVSESGFALGQWVEYNKKRYHALKAGKKGGLAQDRIDAMNAIGFEWGGGKETKEATEAKWNSMFELLKQFNAEKGHCRVPQVYTTDAGDKLGVWVARQRKAVQTCPEKRTAATKQHIERLNAIGFDWGRRGTGWQTGYALLSAYKEQHGDCRVPRSYVVDNVNLGEWVHRQRYRRSLADKSQALGQGKVDKLNALGFEWEE